MKLFEQLKALRDKIIATKADFWAMEKSYIQKTISLNEHATTPKKGEIAPDFYFPGPDDKAVTLSELSGKGPVILQFYRGKWCVFCDLALKAIQKHTAEFERYGATIVAVSPESIALSQLTKQEKELTYQVITDHGNAIADKYKLITTPSDEMQTAYASFGLNLSEMNSDGTGNLPIPATYVIGKGRKVIYSFVDPDYTKRAEPSEVLASIMEYHNSQTLRVAV